LWKKKPLWEYSETMEAGRWTLEGPRQEVGTLAWPLAGSLFVTGLVVAFVCEPPLSPLRSWGQLFSLAVLYLVMAAGVHALAVWSICKIRRDEEDARWPLIWKIIWGAWIAVVWLPLLALLTSEHSVWVAFLVPVTVLFAMLFLKWQAMETSRDTRYEDETMHGFLQMDDSPPLLRVLWPAVFTSITAEVGLGLLIAHSSWLAGGCFAAASIYPFEGLWNGLVRNSGTKGDRSSRRASMGNSITALLLTAAALIPFLRTAYAAHLIEALLGLQPVHAIVHVAKVDSAAHRKIGYEGVILLMPPKPHLMILPVPPSSAVISGVSREIDFDGVYLYFKRPDVGPGPEAHVVRGDPAKERIRSTDQMPLMMEARQRLGTSVAMNCCHSLSLRVKNADTVPGAIAVEVLLRDAEAKHATQVSLGTKVLPSSAVSPMPMHRAPVDDRVTFQIPRGAKQKSFNEITVRIKPEAMRSLAGAQVSVQSFVLHP
jgi:hypothetical protein